MEKFYTFLQNNGENNILAAIFSNVARFVRSIYFAIKNKKVIYLANYGFVSVVVSIIAIPLLYIFARTTVLFSCIFATIIYLSLCAVYVRFYIPYKRTDPVLKRKRSRNNAGSGGDFLNNKPELLWENLEVNRDINKTTGWILGAYKFFGRTHIVSIKDTPKTNRNILLAAISGGGKGVVGSFIAVLTAFVAKKSIIVTSVKEELYVALKNIAKKLHYNVILLSADPNTMKYSDRYNFLDIIRDKKTRAEKLDAAQIFAKCIMDNIPYTAPKDYWGNGEESLFMSVLVNFADIPGASWSDIPRFVATHGLRELDMIVKTIAAQHPSYVGFRTWGMATDTPKTQVLQGMTTRLKVFDNDNIADVLSKSDFKFEDIFKKKTIVFVVADNSEVYKFVTSMFFAQLFKTAQDVANETTGKALPRQTRVIIDEAHAVGVIPGYVKALETCRSINMEIMTIVQSLAQLKTMYPDEYQNILGNCKYHTCLNSGDRDVTTAHFVDMCGKMYVETMSSNKDGGDVRYSEKEVDVCPPELVESLESEHKMLTKITGIRFPFIGERLEYYGNMPGSKIKYENTYDGVTKIYHAHPLMQYYKPVDIRERKTIAERQEEEKMIDESLPDKDVIAQIADKGLEGFEEIDNDTLFA